MVIMTKSDSFAWYVDGHACHVVHPQLNFVDLVYSARIIEHALPYTYVSFDGRSLFL